jgi:hypothetical protein
MTIDERIAALTMNLELAFRDIQDLRGAVNDLKELARQDGENIRALARIAEIHERRLTALEGDDEEQH